MAMISPVRTSMTMAHAPIAENLVIAASSSSRTTPCTRASRDSRSVAWSVFSRWSKNRSTPPTPWSSMSTAPMICAAVRPSG